MRTIIHICESDGFDIKYILKNKLNISSSLISNLKNSNGIFLNGNLANVTVKTFKGDILKLVIPYKPNLNIKPVDLPIDILYEDDDVICLNKPCNIPTHPSHNHYNDTLANRAVNYLSSKNDELHIVTRLDAYTSGIVLAAKNAYSASIMCTKEYNSTVKKIYCGVCRGVFKEKIGIIEAPIGRCDNSIIKRRVREDGKYAKTQYKVICENDITSLVEFRLHTGRTHQIRVHCEYINHPLANDFLYDSNCDESKTFMLHCRKILFCHPYTSELITVNSQLPEYFYK